MIIANRFLFHKTELQEQNHCSDCSIIRNSRRSIRSSAFICGSMMHTGHSLWIWGIIWRRKEHRRSGWRNWKHWKDKWLCLLGMLHTILRSILPIEFSRNFAAVSLLFLFIFSGKRNIIAIISIILLLLLSEVFQCSNTTIYFKIFRLWSFFWWVDRCQQLHTG